MSTKESTRKFSENTFENSVLSNDLFAKVLRRLATFLSVNKSLRGKLVSLSLVMFNDNFSATSVAFFVADFNLLNYEVDKFKFSLPLREKCSYSELFWSAFSAFGLRTDTLYFSLFSSNKG